MDMKNLRQCLTAKTPNDNEDVAAQGSFLTSLLACCKCLIGQSWVIPWYGNGKPPTQISFKLEAKLDMTYGPQTGQGLWVALRSHIQDQEVGPTQMTRTVRVICVGSTFWAY